MSPVTILLDAQFGTPYPRSAGFDTDSHPKRIEQDSQRNNVDAPSPSKKKKKKNDRNLHAYSEPVVDTPENPNDISISDAETQYGNEHEPSENVNDDVHYQIVFQHHT